MLHLNIQPLYTLHWLLTTDIQISSLGTYSWTTFSRSLPRHNDLQLLSCLVLELARAHSLNSMTRVDQISSNELKDMISVVPRENSVLGILWRTNDNSFTTRSNVFAIYPAAFTYETWGSAIERHSYCRRTLLLRQQTQLPISRYVMLIFYTNTNQDIVNSAQEARKSSRRGASIHCVQRLTWLVISSCYGAMAKS